MAKYKGYESVSQGEKISSLRASLHVEEGTPMGICMKIVLGSAALVLIAGGLWWTGKWQDVVNRIAQHGKWVPLIAALAVVGLIVPAIAPFRFFLGRQTVLVSQFVEYMNLSDTWLDGWRFTVATIVSYVLVVYWKWLRAFTILSGLLPMCADLSLDILALHLFWESQDYHYLTNNAMAIIAAGVWACLQIHQQGHGRIMAMLALSLCLPLFLVCFIVFLVVIDHSVTQVLIEDGWNDSHGNELVAVLLQAEGFLEAFVSGGVQSYSVVHGPLENQSQKSALTFSVIIGFLSIAKNFAGIDKRFQVSRTVAIKGQDTPDVEPAYIPVVVGVAPVTSVPYALVLMYRTASVASRMLFFVLFQQVTHDQLQINSVAFGGIALLLLDLLAQAILILLATRKCSKLWYAAANSISVMEPLLHGAGATWTTEIFWCACVHLIEEAAVLVFLGATKGFGFLQQILDESMIFVWIFLSSLSLKYPLLMLIRFCCTYELPTAEVTGLQLFDGEAVARSQADILDKRVHPEVMMLTCTQLPMRGIGMSIDDSSASTVSQCLKRNSKIEKVEFSPSSISDKGAEAFAESLKVNETITQLCLSCNSIGDKGAEALAESLRDNNTICDLNLAVNKISDAGARSFAEGLKINKAIEHVYLSYNNIGDKGAMAIADTLKINSILYHVNLTGNNIGEKGAEALAESLKVNKSIAMFYLSSNIIGDNGAGAVAESWKINSTITMFYLGDNSIGDKGAGALAESLKVNNKMIVVFLSSNHIGDKGAEALADSLKLNKKIQQLCVGGNNISAQGRKFLEECMGPDREIDLQNAWSKPKSFAAGPYREFA